MFETAAPLVWVQDSYQQLILEVYRSLVNDRGVITGVTLSEPSPFDFFQTAGIKVLLRFFENLNRAFPEYELNFENLVTRGEKVMAKYAIKGVQNVKFMGTPPAYRRVRISGIDIFRLFDNQIAEYWNLTHQISPL